MSGMSDLRLRAEKMRQEFFKDDIHKDWFSGHNIFNDEKIQNFFNDERRPEFFQKSQKHEFVNNSKKEDFYHHTSEGNLDEFEKIKQRILDKRSFPWDYEWGEQGNVEIKRNEHKSQHDEETKFGKESHKNAKVDDDFAPIPNGQRRKSLDNLFSKIRDLKCEFQKVEKKLRNAREDLPQKYQDTTSEPGRNRGQHQHRFDNMESQSSRSWVRRTPEEASGPNIYQEHKEYDLYNKEPTSSRSWMHEPSESPLLSRPRTNNESKNVDTLSSRSWVRRPSEQDNLSRRSDRNQNVTTQTSPHESNTYTDTKPNYRSKLDNTTRSRYDGYRPMYEHSSGTNISSFDNTSSSYRQSYDKPAYDSTWKFSDSSHDNPKQATSYPNKNTTDCDEYGISSERRRLNKTDYYPGKISGFPPPSARSKKLYSSPEQTSETNNGNEKLQQNKLMPVKINLVQTIVKEQEDLGKFQKENKNKEDQNEAVSTIKTHYLPARHCNIKQVTDEADETTSEVSSPTYPFQSGVSSNTTSIQDKATPHESIHAAVTPQTAANPHESIHEAVTRQEKVENDATLYPFPDYDAKEKSPSSYTDCTEMLSGVSSPIYDLGTATEMSESHSGISSAMDGLVTGTHSGVSSPTYSMETETHSRVCSPTYDSGTATELSDTHSRVLSPTYTEFSEIESGVSEQSELESTYKTATDCSTSQTSSSSSSSDSSSKSEISAYHIDLTEEAAVPQKDEGAGNLEEDCISQNQFVSSHPEKGEHKTNIAKDDSIPVSQEKIKDASFNSVENLKVLETNNEKMESSHFSPKKENLPLNLKKDEQPTVISVKIEQEIKNPLMSEHSAFNSNKSRKYSPDPGYNSNSSTSTIRSPSLCHSETYIQMPVVHSGVKGRVEVEKRVLGSWQVSWNTVVREQQVSWDVNNVMDGNNRIRMGDDKFSWIAIEYIYQN